MSDNSSCFPRLLFLAINFENWVAPTIFYEQQAIQRLMPQSVFYGPGYRYESNHVQGIVEEVFGHNLPDAIFCYIDERRLLGEPLPQQIVSQYNIKPSLRVFPRGLKDIKVPKIAWINDFWHCSRDEWEEILLGNGFEMAFATYAPPFTSEDIFGQFFSQRVRESVKFVPWPRAIHPAVFRDFGLEKKYDVSLLGARDAAFYPLREKMHETFSRQKNLSYFSQSHPGYCYHATGTALTGEAYARVINQSKIFASCTGRYNIPFIKLYEVLACRTVLMCDRPSGAEYLGLMDGENYIAISQNNFLEKAICLLSDRILIDRIANEANALFLSRHTVDVRAREFVKTVHAGLQGKTAEGWASLYPIRKGARSLTAGPSSVTCPAKHIREICSTADETALIIWNKYGVNNRPHETPPVVTEHPELVVLRGVYLRRLAERIGAKHFAEVGTARGFQSFMWAQYLLETSPDGLVYTCDIDGMDQPIYKTPLTGDRIFTRRQLWQGSPQARIVRFVHGDSRKLAQEIKHEIDLVFIDGEHSEKAVLRDFTALLSNLHPGPSLSLTTAMTDSRAFREPSSTYPAG